MCHGTLLLLLLLLLSPAAKSVRCPTPRPLTDRDRPLALHLAVGPDPATGALALTASSGVRFENRTGHALELGADSAAWPGATVAFARLEPGAAAYLPLFLSDAMHVAVRAAAASTADKLGGGGGGGAAAAAWPRIKVRAPGRKTRGASLLVVP